MNVFAGIDVGSATTKAVVLRKDKIVGFAVNPTIPDRRIPANTLEQALIKTKFRKENISRIVATGYGRINVDFADKIITEITCHGMGAKWLNKKITAVIDIGGQDSKAIVLNEHGEVNDFVMNDKCAAGTGRFIELIANTLNIPLEKVGKLSLKGKKPADISSMCAVFAESEVVSLVAEGVSSENILAGIHKAIARRVVSMARRTGLEQKTIALTGGIAKNVGMVRALEQELGTKIYLSKEPQIVGALGAALLAAQHLNN